MAAGSRAGAPPARASACSRWAAAPRGSCPRPTRRCARTPAPARPTPSTATELPPERTYDRAVVDQPQRHDHRGHRRARRRSAIETSPPPRSPPCSAHRSPQLARRSRRPGLRRRALGGADAVRDRRARAAARAPRRGPRPRDRRRRARRSPTRCPSSPRAFDHFVFLGHGWTVGLAHEAALKMREAAQAHTESYPAMEYRHGPISLAGPGSLVWILGTPDPTIADDVRATGATVLEADPRPDGRAATYPTDGRRAQRSARPRPRPSAPPDPLGGAAAGGNRMKRATIVLAVGGARRRGVFQRATPPSSQTSAGAPVHITLWHGYGNVDRGERPDELRGEVAQRPRDAVQRDAPRRPGRRDVRRQQRQRVQKLTVALQGGDPAGHHLPVRDLAAAARRRAGHHRPDRHRAGRPAGTGTTSSPASGPPRPSTATCYGVPALVDNLAIVYNKALFDAAGLSYPTADWTWDDFRDRREGADRPCEEAVRGRLPGRRQRGHRVALRRDALGGRRRHPERRQHAGGVQLSRRACRRSTTLQQMAVTDQSMYLDLQNTEDRRPVQQRPHRHGRSPGRGPCPATPTSTTASRSCPSYPGGNHQTIAGPDMWVMFDNGDAREGRGARVHAVAHRHPNR